MNKKMENEMTIQLRNEQIVERFCTLAESQPLATCNSIIDYLAKVYSMTNMNIRHILKDAGIDTARTNKMN